MRLKIYKVEVYVFLILFILTGLSIHFKLKVFGFVFYDKFEHLLLGFLVGWFIKQFKPEISPFLYGLLFAISFEVIWSIIGNSVGNQSIGEISISDGFKFLDELLDGFFGLIGFLTPFYLKKI